MYNTANCCRAACVVMSSEKYSEAFSIWAPSGVFENFYPNNTLSHYTVKLPSQIQLDNVEYQVGVKEILINSRVFNLTRENANFSLIDLDEKKKTEFEALYFDPSLENTSLEIDNDDYASYTDSYKKMANMFDKKTMLGFLNTDGSTKYLKRNDATSLKRYLYESQVLVEHNKKRRKLNARSISSNFIAENALELNNVRDELSSFEISMKNHENKTKEVEDRLNKIREQKTELKASLVFQESANQKISHTTQVVKDKISDLEKEASTKSDNLATLSKVKQDMLEKIQERRLRESSLLESKKKHQEPGFREMIETTGPDSVRYSNFGVWDLGIWSLDPIMTKVQQARPLPPTPAPNKASRTPDINVSKHLLQSTVRMGHYKLRPGVYLSIDSIISEINGLLDKNNNNFKNLSLVRKDDGYSVLKEGKKVSNNILIRLCKVLQILFNSPTEYILAKDFEKLRPDKHFDPSFFSPRIAYLYSDIVNFSTIGNVQARVLCSFVLPVDQKNSYCHIIYPNPHYVQVSKHVFSDITIDIRDESGDPIPFERGNICLKLDFRKKIV